MGKVVCALALALALAGCSNPWAAYRPSEAERLRADWYPPSSQRLEPRFCYRTLARVDCFAQPQLGQSGRQVGSFDALAD